MPTPQSAHTSCDLLLYSPRDSPSSHPFACTSATTKTSAMSDPLAPELPDALISSIVEQSAVLFLGAGASYGAYHPSGARIPSSDDLKALLSDKFLGGKLKARSLSHVAEMCISETDMLTVQMFVRDNFLPFGPGPHHLVIPRFYWHAIVTTNYDLILEKAYASETKAKQELAVFLKNGQKVDTKLKSLSNGLRYIKLHGSVDHIDDSDIPLILAKEQYVRYLSNRNRLFSAFEQIAYEFPIIFCGYSIDDHHIQDILFDLANNAISRPRYYLVSPDLDPVEQRYWQSHRVTCISATFEAFLLELERIIPEAKRSIPLSIGGGQETVRTFYSIANPTESNTLKHFLANDVDHVRLGMATLGVEAKQFYLGADTGWGPIAAELDVRRRITDNIIVDAILADERDRHRVVDLHVLKGPAGHGKTTTLRRVAWESSISYSKLCLFVKEEGAVLSEPIRELWELTQQRVFLFIDRAALRIEELMGLLGFLADNTIPVTIVTAERDNEWNVRCGRLDEYVTQTYPLRNLSEPEIHTLLTKLENHGALGRLADLSYHQRVEEFLVRAERQLLVALHEATFGKSFEEIVRDEFDRIIPTEAQTLYMDVCTLNRLGIPVRAGLIARVSGIRFADFEERFFKPLEHVVKNFYDPYVGDRMYTARHAHIADIVFLLNLADSEERFEQIIRILQGVNIDYSSDNEAFRSLIRGKSISELFGSYELGRRIYEYVGKLVGADAHALQQRALFEMSHRGGSLSTAEDNLKQALEIAPYDRTIQHTYANLKRMQANGTSNSLLKSKLRVDSRRYLRALVDREARTSHGYHTLILVLLDDLRDLLAGKKSGDLDQMDERQIVNLVRDIELQIREGQQRFPDEERLLSAEVVFRELLEEDGRAIQVLRKAFDKNPRSEWVAVRMGRRLVEIGNVEEAKQVLERCARENPGSKAVNFSLAQLHLEYGTEEDRSRVIGHLRRSFSEGDTHYDAQFWYARELFLTGDIDGADNLFNQLGHAPVSPEIRNRIRGWISDGDRRAKVFTAMVRRKEEAYIFASPEEFPKDVFCHSSQASEEAWAGVTVGGNVKLHIGFSMRGPAARLMQE